MKLDIRKKVIKHKLRSLFLAIGVTTLVIVIILSGFFDKPFGNLTKFHLVIIIAILYVLYVVYNHLRFLNYIYYNDETDKIILRYYSLNPFSQSKQSIEIPKKSFTKFRIEENLFGIRQQIILYQRIQKGIFKYPPVSITLLSKEEKENIIGSLKSYTPK